jgi:hypothetical protein
MEKYLDFKNYEDYINEIITYDNNYSRGAIYHPTKSQQIKRKRLLARKNK